MKDFRIRLLHGAVERAKVGEKALESHRRRFEAHIREIAPALSQPWGVEDPGISKHALDVIRAREQAAGLAGLLQAPRRRTLDLDISGEFQLFPEPYDDTWHVGVGTPENRDGKPIVFESDGFSAAGFALDLTTSSEVWASVLPQGQFTGSWMNFSLDAAPQQRSAAGTGVVVYAGNDLVLARTSRVWDVAGMAPMTGKTYDLAFADTATPAFPGSFGPIPLAPVLITMEPGIHYQVWFYVWQLNTPLKPGVIVACEGDVPLVTISASPPPRLN